MTTILAPYTSIADIDGSPLDAGFVFIGEQGKNPESSPVSVFWDAEFTIPAAQPIRTRNGYPVRNGSPAKIYLREPMHSISVKNRNGSTIFVDVSGAGLVSTLLVRPSGVTVEQTFNNIDASLAEKQQQINEKAPTEYVNEQLALKAPQSTTYTKTEVDSALDQKAPQSNTYTKAEVDTAFAAYAGGRKGFTTLALAQAAQSTLPADTVVDVTNDPDPTKNGTYQWNGTTLTKSAHDPLTQAKEYTNNYVDTESLNLFKREVNLGYTNNMLVRRYTDVSTFTDYAAGTYQTLSGDKVELAVAKAGSSNIKHYFVTTISHQVASFEFTVKTIDVASDSIGIGFLDGGVYTAITYSTSGTVRKFVDYDNPGGAIASSLGNVIVGDKLRFDYANNEVSIYLNDALKIKTALVGGGVFIIGQGSFGTYSSTAGGENIDPVRDYVKGQIASATVNAQSPGYYSYSADTKTFMAYSQVKGNLYVGFEVQRETDMSDLIYKDYWRMLQAAFYTYENGVMQATGKMAVIGGENEFVFKQNSTKDDFTGGYHGDELVTDIKLMVDGFPISIAASIPLTPANRLEYIEKSTMHETAEGGVFIPSHPIVAYHTKHTTFKDGGYKTWNHVKWNYAGTMSTLYHGISCISKDVASVGFSDDTFTDESFTGSDNNFFTAIGTRLFKGRNPASGLAVEAVAYQTKDAAGDALSELFVKDRSADSKYYRKSPPKAVSVDEIHESYFECRFFAI